MMSRAACPFVLRSKLWSGTGTLLPDTVKWKSWSTLPGLVTLMIRRLAETSTLIVKLSSSVTGPLFWPCAVQPDQLEVTLAVLVTEVTVLGGLSRCVHS